MKPIKYRLMLGQLSTAQTDSLKVLASVMFYVGRRAAKSIPQILVCHQREKRWNGNDFFLLVDFTTWMGAFIIQWCRYWTNYQKFGNQIDYDHMWSKLFIFHRCPSQLSSIDLIKLSLRVWCEEYIRRIDGSFAKELRTWEWSLAYSFPSMLLFLLTTYLIVYSFFTLPHTNAFPDRFYCHDH